jgi:hypothetical protein
MLFHICNSSYLIRRSLDQRSPTDCDVTACDLENSWIRRPRPKLGCCTREREKDPPLPYLPTLRSIHPSIQSRPSFWEGDEQFDDTHLAKNPFQKLVSSICGLNSEIHSNRELWGSAQIQQADDDKKPPGAECSLHRRNTTRWKGERACLWLQHVTSYLCGGNTDIPINSRKYLVFNDRIQRRLLFREIQHFLIWGQIKKKNVVQEQMCLELLHIFTIGLDKHKTYFTTGVNKYLESGRSSD